MPPRSSARGLALAALSEWRQGDRLADSILQQCLEAAPLAPADRGFATELFYGVLRNLTLLDFWIALLRAAPVDTESRDLLRLGLYQILLLRTPGHAAVFETVALASSRRRPLINGVLRSAQRRVSDLESAAAKAPLATRRSHPPFLLQRWNEKFGAPATEVFCEWNNTPAPVYARVNPLKISLAQFLRDHPTSDRVDGVEGFVRVSQLPRAALERGECYVQDPSTRIACEMLGPRPGDDVLDACAAPGGKSGLLAALMENQGSLIASDRDPVRVETLRENLQRLGAQNAIAVCHDWTSGNPLDMSAPALFDRILLDAPCSNTGVMRRRVDVRWRLRPDDFARLQKQQGRLLRALVPRLKPGGALVYSTCSVETEENEQVVAAARRDFPFLTMTEEKTILPFRDGFDGAFAARLVHTG